jgi:hypothetical protein
MIFQLNKNDLIAKFREHIKKTSDEKEDNFDTSKAKKVNPLDKYETLINVRRLYDWVLENSKIELRRAYIHDDQSYNDVKNSLQSRVKNKIRSKSDGTLMLNINNGKFIFSGDPEQYKENLVKNKNKLVNVMRAVIDELNSVLSDQAPEEEGRVMLRDAADKLYREWCKENYQSTFKAEELADVILQSLPESIWEDPATNIPSAEFAKLFKEHWAHAVIHNENPFLRMLLGTTINHDNIDNIIKDFQENYNA